MQAAKFGKGCSCPFGNGVDLLSVPDLGWRILLLHFCSDGLPSADTERARWITIDDAQNGW